MSTEHTTRTEGAPTWAVANRRYLDLELERLRLLLRRQIGWLKTQWPSSAHQSYQGLVISDEEVERMLGADGAAEREFFLRDEHARQLSTSLEKLELEIAAMSRALTGAPPAIDVLTRLFGLTTFERGVLLLTAAPEMDPTFERLYAYVQNDATRRYATPHLALTLLGGDTESSIQAKERLMPNSVLRRLRLLSVDVGTSPSVTAGGSPLRIQERVLDYILGVNQIDERVAGLLTSLPPAPLAPHHEELLERLHRRLIGQATRGAWPVINLVGPKQSGKRALARALCERIGLRLLQFDTSGLLALGTERHDLLRLMEREAAMSQFAVYLDGERTASDNGASVVHVVEHLNAFLVLGSTDPWLADRKMTQVVVPKPDALGQGELWRRALAQIPNSVNGEIQELVQQFEFGPTAVARAIDAARNRAQLRASGDEMKIAPEDLWSACREQAGVQMDATAERIVPCHGWDDIVLPKNVEEQLREIAAQVALRPQVYETWGFGSKLNRGRGISALFSGPSGTGKTMAAEILASHLELDLFRIDLSGVVSKYIGETEKNLKRVFDAAEQGGAILFFDEADALFGKRSEVKDSHDRYANIEVNYLLQRMEDYRGLAILATNKKSHLDSAFMRRLRFVVDFPFPDASLRVRIWQKAFPESASVEGLDFGALSRLDISGGNIKNIVLNAAFLAADERSAIRMDQLLRAARREYAKIDKLITVSDFGSYGATAK